MEIDREAVLQVFFAEAEESFFEQEAALIKLESHPEDSEALGRLFRGMHSLKGDASSAHHASSPRRVCRQPRDPRCPHKAIRLTE